MTMKAIHGLAILLLGSIPSHDAFQIGQLVSTCIDACQRGCHEIKEVQKQGGDALDVEMKDESDSRSVLTQADHASQTAIVGSLRATWGDTLNIVGEEEEDPQLLEEFAAKGLGLLDKSLLDDDIGETNDLDPEDITIFVDPLDGTREFVEGRLENCQVLVGIAIQGQAVAGAMGIPFPTVPNDEEDDDPDPTVVYGLVDMGTGFVGTPLSRGPFPLERNIDGVKYPRPHHATGDGQHEVVASAMEKVVHFMGGSNVIYGGAGNKILAAALGECATSIQHKVGGPWDLCAPEAIAKAMGADVTNFFGEEIDIYRKDSPANANERGFLVSGTTVEHQQLVNCVLASDKVQEYQKSLLEAVDA